MDDIRKPYVARTLESFFGKASTQFPVMLVTAARQTGKTTFLRTGVSFFPDSLKVFRHSGEGRNPGELVDQTYSARAP